MPFSPGSPHRSRQSIAFDYRCILYLNSSVIQRKTRGAGNTALKCEDFELSTTHQRTQRTRRSTLVMKVARETGLYAWLLKRKLTSSGQPSCIVPGAPLRELRVFVSSCLSIWPVTRPDSSRKDER